jgi:hypothetical protein
VKKNKCGEEVSIVNRREKAITEVIAPGYALFFFSEMIIL